MAVTYCPSCGEWVGDWYTYNDRGGASCTSGGTVYRTYYYECGNCGWTTTEEESWYQSALGHSFSFQSTVAPQIGAQGYDIYKCSRCGTTEKRNYKDALKPCIICVSKFNGVWTTVVPYLKKDNIWTPADFYAKINDEWLASKNK